MTVHHHLSVDVEEYFQPSALEAWISRDEWDSLPRRSPSLIPVLLDWLAHHEVLGTFFILGWLAKREPDMVRRISEAGHEIASHGWDHRRVTELAPKEFRTDLRESRMVLQDLSGQPITGFRAPSFSILPGTEWALDILVEEGFEYDSSMFPVWVHPGYGYPEAEPDPHVIVRGSGALVEIPPATLRVGGFRMPAAGGAYLRFFPALLVRKALEACEGRGVPGTVYCHPWEFDLRMPCFQAPRLTRVRMRWGIRRMEDKVSYLMERFAFAPMRDIVATLRLEQTKNPG